MVIFYLKWYISFSDQLELLIWNGDKDEKILVVLTNTARYGAKNEATGLWLSEATEFVKELIHAGYGIDYVSPRGGYVPIDPRSLKNAYVNEDVFAFYNSKDFRDRALANSLQPSDIDASNYTAVYYTGGHGVVWDFPENKALQAISREIYERDGYVTSVCHGLAGLLSIKTSDNNYLISGKTLTGFTETEEILSGKNRLVPFGTEKEAKKRGAKFVKKRAFSSFAVQDGHLITGQNPMSGQAVAKCLLKNLKASLSCPR